MDYQTITPQDFKPYVVQIASEAKPNSISFYAATSLLEVMEKYDIETFDPDALKLWVASMLLAGRKINTVSRYLSKIRALFDQWSEMSGDTSPETGAPHPFDQIKSALGENLETNPDSAEANLEFVKRLISKDESSKDWQTVSIFFYLLYLPDITLLDIANATFDNAPNYCAQVDRIVKACNASNGRKYLFSLNQSKIRPTQLFRELTDSLTLLMKSAGMRLANAPVRDEITAIWIAAALKCGIDIRDIRAIIPAVPYSFWALTILPKKEIPNNRKHDIICRVADFINDNTPRWFVMKLRKGIDIQGVKEKIEAELPGRLASMELFYPTHEVAKKVGKKLHKKKIPYISDLLFFRTPYNKVRGLFAKIGDIAWCFKASQLADSPYSVISHEEMANFQRYIGQFTSDVKIELSESKQHLGIGRMVRITGGMMKGYKGIIEDLNDGKGTRKFFLRISSDNALNWTAEVDELFIEPLENS